MELRKRVEERLVQHRAEIQKQLDAIALLGGERRGRGPGSALRGRKVVIIRTRGGASIYSWTVGLSVRCADRQHGRAGP